MQGARGRVSQPQKVGQAGRVRVFDLFGRRRPHVYHIDQEAQRHAGKWMVAIEHRHALGDVSHGEQDAGTGVVRGAFDPHADFDVRANFIQRHQHHEIRVIVAKGFMGLELQRNVRARDLASQLFFDAAKNVIVPVQIDKGLGRLLKERALRVVHRDIEADQCAVVDLHRAMCADAFAASPGVCTGEPTYNSAGVPRAMPPPAMPPPAMPSEDRAVLRQLGQLSVAHFMRDYWQRRPVVLRNVFAQFKPPIERAQLFAWARDPHVESRLITAFDGRWTLRHGPIARLPSRRRPGWTLLTQGVDLLDEAAHRLLARFRFVTDARLDDLMISYASDGGGVGAHVDSYDVFLLQAQGRRRWRISRQHDLATAPGQPLKVLRNFQPSREWVLDPGDMLYLPPGVAHEGTAIGECMTWSVGFRAPTMQELIDPWLALVAERARLPGRYADRGLRPAEHPAALPAAMVARIHRQLSRVRPARADTEAFLLRHLSEPKAQVVFSAPSRPLGAAAFRGAARRQGVALDRRTRMLHSPGAIAVNGERIETGSAALRRLADQRGLSVVQLGAVASAHWPHLHDWYRAGWLHLGCA